MAFTGNNEQGTVEAFISRLNFKVNIDREVKNRSSQNTNSKFAKCLKDFRFGETITYGKIDTIGQPVILDPSGDSTILRKVGQSDDAPGLMAVNFVADAFADLEKYFKAARQNGKIKLDDPYLSVPTPKRAYVSFEMLKKAARDGPYTNGFMEYIFGMEAATGNTIGTFDVFMRNFLHYVNQVSFAFPFLKPEMLKHRSVPLLTSGLVIEIAEGDFSKDNPIDQLFYKSDNFDYYLNVAMKVGFSVDRNAPWRLVADLGSPTMRQYMAEYGITGPDSFFSTYCRPGHRNDFEEFMDFTLQLYNYYVQKKNRTSKPATRGKLILTEKYNLERMNRIKVYRRYGPDYLINKYVELKNIENRNYVGKRELEVLKVEIAEIGKLKMSDFEKNNKISALVDAKFKGLRGKGTLSDKKRTLVDRRRNR
jgi:hypothetical protein